MTLRAFVVDDEPLAVQRLTKLLRAGGRVDVVGSETDPEAARVALTQDPVDVVFLDIEMPQCDGLEVARSLPEGTAVVFTTAYDRYALRAFKVSAVDYLLKPVRAADLSRALDRVERLAAPRADAGAAARVDAGALLLRLEEALAASRTPPERIASRLGDRIHLIDLATVSHFQAEGKLTHAMAEGKAYIVDPTLSELEERLAPHRFFRIHRSTLVQLSFIEEIHSWFGQGLRVHLRDTAATKLTVARDRARSLKEALAIR